MVKIRIVPNIEEEMQKNTKYVDDVLSGKIKKVTKKGHTIIMTPETFAKIFSPQKVKLLIKIKNNNIKNIYQLAKDLNRKYEAVHRDIRYLEQMGLIKIRSKADTKIPTFNESIEIPTFTI